MKLIQFHFHSPIENRIESKSFPLEAHLVHADKEGNLAVVAVIFKEGRKNGFQQKVWEVMPKTAQKHQASSHNMNKESINVKNMLPMQKDYYYFTGSLTTPSCNEGVH